MISLIAPPRPLDDGFDLRILEAQRGLERRIPHAHVPNAVELLVLMDVTLGAHRALACLRVVREDERAVLGLDHGATGVLRLQEEADKRPTSCASDEGARERSAAIRFAIAR